MRTPRNNKIYNVIISIFFLLAIYELRQIHLELVFHSKIWQLRNSTLLGESTKISNKFVIYAITPTYKRSVQKAELTALSQVLRLSSIPIHWIVVEDSGEKTPLIAGFLNESNLTYTHLTAKTLSLNTLKVINAKWNKHKGVEQRNQALHWIRRNLKYGDGAVYFMDDDNTYDFRLFEEIAKIKKVGVWPVGFAGGANVETPTVNAGTGKVDGFDSGWRNNRTFPMDMAGFAIHLRVILEKFDVFFSYSSGMGMLENDFLMRLTTIDELEPLADNCTKVYVWHTKRQRPRIYELFPGIEV